MQRRDLVFYFNCILMRLIWLGNMNFHVYYMEEPGVVKLN